MCSSSVDFNNAAENEVLSNFETESNELLSTQNSPRNSPTSQDDFWTDTEEDPVSIPFIGNPRITTNLQPSGLPIDCFNLFFDDSIFEIIYHETNKRATAILQSQKTRSKRDKLWKNITVNEMKRFIGICCLSGTIVFPLLAKQWSKHPLYFHPVFGRTMSRNRFQMILKMLKFANHDDFDPTDKIFKIRPILNKILQNIKTIFYPDKNLFIDEAMIGWQGLLSFRQYIANKSHKCGIKLYELTTYDGFILNILVYTGRGTLQGNNTSLAESVVKTLLTDYLGKGHTVYLDNFYTSVPLAEALFKEKTGCVETLRENRRGNPKRCGEKKIKKEK
ncbi:hypothetical protein NQ314_002569 [Rhamnusium bicolor]|uniref:PiggyBac transposable element-derived protein domain-containing protein n=1 Tax=Rhamnusium bicolor TaxID=1586634 RepID=A0AAV8ZSM5_9CUCU|nr:hypothetical protein NQ314_002569 [Rhamnusium bicolor]